MGGNNYQLIQTKAPAQPNRKRRRPAQKRKRRPNRKPLRQQRQAQYQDQKALAQICAVFDPFCKSSQGMKQNSKGTEDTVAGRGRYAGAFTAQVDSNDNNKRYVALRVPNDHRYAAGECTVLGGDVTNVDAKTWPQYTSWNDQFSMARSVNTAARLRYTGSPLNATGQVIIGKLTNGRDPFSHDSANYPQSYAEALNFPGSEIYSVRALIEKPVIVPCTRIGSNYTDFHGLAADDVEQQLTGVFIWAEDLATDGAFYLEVLSDKEFTPRANSFAVEFSKPGIIYSSQLDQATDIVSMSLPKVFHGTTDKFTEMADGLASVALKRVTQMAGQVLDHWNDPIVRKGVYALGSIASGGM